VEYDLAKVTAHACEKGVAALSWSPCPCISVLPVVRSLEGVSEVLLSSSHCMCVCSDSKPAGL